MSAAEQHGVAGIPTRCAEHQWCGAQARAAPVAKAATFGFEYSGAGSDLGGGPGLREEDGSSSRADSVGDELTLDELRMMNNLSADAEPDYQLQRQNGLSLQELPARILHADLGRYEQVCGAAMRSKFACGANC